MSLTLFDASTHKYDYALIDAYKKLYSPLLPHPILRCKVSK